MAIKKFLNGDKLLSTEIVSAGGVNLENLFKYSTDETPIGTWINGKTIYRRIYPVSLSAAGTYEIADVPTNMELAIRLYGWVTAYSNTNFRMLPMVGHDMNNMIRLDVTNRKIRIIQTDSWTGYNGYIIMEYTKK